MTGLSDSRWIWSGLTGAARSAAAPPDGGEALPAVMVTDTGAACIGHARDAEHQNPDTYL